MFPSLEIVLMYLGYWYYDILKFLYTMNRYHIKHCLREANFVVDHLAKEAAFNQEFLNGKQPEHITHYIEQFSLMKP